MAVVHFILESLFFVSGIALTIVAGIGLRQLTIAKDIARTDAHRESLKLAADQCLHYMNYIIPAQDALDVAVKSKKIAFFAKSQAEVKDDTVKVTSTATGADKGALETIAKEFLAAFNPTEAFAVFFFAGVANERVAFSAVGTTYCNNVRIYLPLLMILRPGAFANTLKLFFLWNSRLESERLRTEREEIDNKLAKIQNKFIKPVGT